MDSIKYLACTAGGVAIGYYIAHQRLTRDFQERLERETDEAKDFYRRKYEKKAQEDTGFLENAVEAADALIKTLGYGVEEGITEEVKTEEIEKTPEVVTPEMAAEIIDPPPLKVRGLTREAKKPPLVNYNRISTPDKTEAKAEADKPAEVAKLDLVEDEPDVRVEYITKDAFIEDQFSYKQFSFTYYAGDDTLANEDDEAVTGAAREASLGFDALNKLKVGREAMEGEDVIFVRNHTGHWEFEITRSDGKYSDEVGAESG